MDDRPGRRRGAVAAQDHAELRDYLQTLRTRLWWREALVLLATSSGVGAVLAMAAALVDVRGDAPVDLQPFVIGVMAVAGGAAFAFARRPSGARAARTADHYGQLENRLATALEILEGRMHGDLAPMQLAETWRACRDFAPRTVLPTFSAALRNTTVAAIISAGVAIVVISHVDDLRAWSTGWLPPVQTRDDVGVPPPLDASAASPTQLEATSGVASIGQPDDMSAATTARLRDQIQQQDAQSRARQDAVAKLANTLQGTAAAQDVGASLQRGAYDTAAGQLRDLARESDQLSASSKLELARALLQVSKDSGSLDQSLATAEEEAARALGRGDYLNARGALENLAQVVSSPPQSPDVARQLQSLQRQNGSTAGSGVCGGGDAYAAAPVDCSPAALYSTGAMRSSVQRSDVPSPLAGNGDVGSGAGYASGGGGASPLGDTVTRIDTSGDNVVQVDLTPSGAQGRGGQPDPKAATTVISQMDQKDVVQNGVPQPGQPIVDVAESTSVAPAQGQTVRSFFQVPPAGPR
jgi:hypothetical protein